MNPLPGLTVLIPCYNEEAVISETYRRVTKVLGEMKDVEGNILFVDDGSKDQTLAILSSLAQEDPALQILSLSRNFGHQAAVTAGIHHCASDYIVVIDADLQDPPELFPQMWRVMQESGANVVYGVRNSREGESLFKKTTAKLFYRFLNYLSDTPFPLDAGDFRMMDRKVSDAFCNLREHNKYVRGLISWVGYKQIPFYYDRAERRAGETKYGLSQMAGLAMNAIHYFSVRPLKIASSLGFLCVIIGIVMAVWVILGKVYGFTHPDSGWSSILITVIFFGGVQLLCIGLLGRYIGVIFDEVKSRPEYIISQSINIKANDKK